MIMAGVPVYRFKSLKTRLTVLLLIPVTLLLLGGGVVTFIYTRNLMLTQWHESAVLKLSRAAHSIEMRLTAPMMILNALFGEGTSFNGTGDDLAALLKNISGVLDARFVPDPARRESDTGSSTGTEMRMAMAMGLNPGPGRGGQGRRSGMGFHRSRISDVSTPEFNATAGGKTVAMTMEITDKKGNLIGTLKVEMGFDYLLEEVANQGWWHSFRACLVTLDGRYLAHANKDMTGRTVMGELGDELEKAVLDKIAASQAGTVSSREHPPKEIAGFYTLKSAPWVLVLFGRGEDVLKPIILYRNLFFAGSIVMVVLILLLIRAHTGRVIREIRSLSRAAGEVAGGEYGSPIPVQGRDEISQLVKSYNTMIEGLKERDFIRDSFGRYVDPEFARQLMERPDTGRMGGERRQVVILMSDLRGFTPLSESLAPEVIIEMLNRYFSRMIHIIQSFHGIIVDFFGDAVLVFFDPLDAPVGHAAEDAVACAEAMQKSMADVNRELASKALPELFMGVGMHTGQVVVGNIGSSARAKYGIVGSAVNVTSRIQARAEPGEILISSDLHDLVPDTRVNRSFQADLKGIRETMTLHTVSLD